MTNAEENTDAKEQDVEQENPIAVNLQIDTLK